MRFRLKIITFLLIGTLLPSVTGCSNQILLENGAIATMGHGGVSISVSETETPQTTATVPGNIQMEIITGSLGSSSGNHTGQSPASSGGITIEVPTEPRTDAVINIGDPMDAFINAEHLMRVDFLNTGKSDCILLRLDDTVILMDTGEVDDYLKIQGKLSEYGITTIDYLIISHFDNDHIGTVARVLTDYTVKTVYMPDYVRDSGLYRNMIAAIAQVSDRTTVYRLQGKADDVRIMLDYGSVWINASDLYERGAEVGADATNEGVDENNFSLITSVYFGDVSLLLTGDAEEDRMAEFWMVCADDRAYSLVKTPHHGSYDDALVSFLDVAKPRYCVVCTDTEDSVHPFLETTMNRLGIGDYYTYDGDILFTTDGRNMVMQQK